MTTADLTVYGRPVGSMWDRRIGGRYELMAIVDDGGRGMWVKLRRVDGVHELAMSVHKLGRDFVAVPEKVEPDEDETCDCSTCSYGRAHLAMYPNNPALPEPDRLLEATVDDNQSVPLVPVYFQDEATGEVQMANQSRCRDCAVGEPHACRYLTPGPGVRRVLVIPAPEPAPSPLLPWAINPGWYRGMPGSVDEGYAYDLGVDERTPTDCEPGDAYERVAVIPWDLIERFRQPADLGEAIMRDKALLDAAEATP